MPPSSTRIDPPETRVVQSATIACDGHAGVDGHPRVWLHIPEETGWIDCPYCDCRYVARSDAAGVPAP